MVGFFLTNPSACQTGFSRKHPCSSSGGLRAFQYVKLWNWLWALLQVLIKKYSLKHVCILYTLLYQYQYAAGTHRFICALIFFPIGPSSASAVTEKQNTGNSVISFDEALLFLGQINNCNCTFRANDPFLPHVRMPHFCNFSQHSISHPGKVLFTLQNKALLCCWTRHTKHYEAHHFTGSKQKTQWL